MKNKTFFKTSVLIIFIKFTVKQLWQTQNSVKSATILNMCSATFDSQNIIGLDILTNTSVWLPLYIFLYHYSRYKTPANSGYILDLYRVRLSNAVHFWKNYAKIYFDARHLEKGLNRRGDFFGPFFQKKCPFWPLSNTALNF